MSYGDDKKAIAKMWSRAFIIAGFSNIAFFAGLFFMYPYYNVWSSGMSGEAKLRQAEQEKRILITTAQAELEAAELQAQAIEVVGETAQKYPEYREQQFMQSFGNAIEGGDVKMIFVPTEANIPILKTAD